MDLKIGHAPKESVKRSSGAAGIAIPGSWRTPGKPGILTHILCPDRGHGADVAPEAFIRWR